MDSYKQQLSEYTHLRYLIIHQDREAARQLIHKNAAVNPPAPKYSNTPLHWAIIKFRDTEIIGLLIDKKADIYARNRNGLTPLHIAIKLNRIRIVNLFCQKKVISETLFKVLITFAMKEKRVSMVKILVKNSAETYPMIDLQNLVPLAVKIGCVKILELIIPHCRYSSRYDRTIPPDFVVYNRKEQMECIDLLFKHGFYIDSENKEKSFIFKAVKNGVVPIIEHLLESGIDVNMKDEYGECLLFKALTENRLKIAEKLIKYKADVNACITREEGRFMRVEPNQNYLYLALRLSNPKMAKLLLDNGIKVHNKFIESVIRSNSDEIMRVIIDRDINLKAINSEGDTFLHLCCIPYNYIFEETLDIKRCEIIKMLVDKGADVNAETVSGETPLAIAMAHQYHAVMKILLNYNVNVRISDENGRTPLHILCQNARIYGNDDQQLMRFLELGADVSSVDDGGNSALHYACMNQNINFIRVLIENGADVNLKNAVDFTPLHLVTRNKYSCISERGMENLRIIEILLGHNADVNDVDDRKQTALHYACKNYNINTVRLLLKNGADVNAVDVSGFTPILRAARSLPIIQCLLGHKADIYAQNNDGKTLLHLAAECGCRDVVKFVLHRNIDIIYVYDNYGRTALHSAVLTKNELMIETLLNYGIDIQKVDVDNHIAFYYLTKILISIQERLDYIERNRMNDGFYKTYNWELETISRDYSCVRKIVDVFNQYVFKLKYAGINLKLNPALFSESIYRETDDERSNEYLGFNVSAFRARCNAEIESMKIVTMGDDNVTLYNLLIRGYRGIIKNIFSYGRIMAILDSEWYRERFPLYIDIIKARMAESAMRNELLETAEQSMLPGIFIKLPHECVDLILGYLNVRDVKVFLNAK